jgi:hypothetical protein
LRLKHNLFDILPALKGEDFELVTRGVWPTLDRLRQVPASEAGILGAISSTGIFFGGLPGRQNIQGDDSSGGINIFAFHVCKFSLGFCGYLSADSHNLDILEVLEVLEVLGWYIAAELKLLSLAIFYVCGKKDSSEHVTALIQ